MVGAEVRDARLWGSRTWAAVSNEVLIGPG